MPMDMRDMMAPPPSDDGGEFDSAALLAALDQVKAQIDDIAAQLVTQKPPKTDTESPAEDAAPTEEED
jgi:hypothetical protein